MKMLLTTLILTTLTLSVRGFDKCGDQCTSTQVCAKNGTCLNKSDLVKCGLFLPYYCYKGQECCGYKKCMPAGAVCCGNKIYCRSGRTCCGSVYCCKPGFSCYGNGKCILDQNYRQVKEYSDLPVPTRNSIWKPSVETRHAKSSSRTSSTSKSRWWYGAIAGTVVFTVAIIIATFIWNRRNNTSNAPGRSGCGRMVQSAPAQTYRQSPGNGMPRMAPNTDVTDNTNGLPPNENAAFVVTE
ncbi:uncharacterized protein LOC123544944 isoform X2 [Mercenaria mercenaria]|uniref:uncharacterized protein LOC123544944 isoform X2 n=1 Tax=Mercenaria mercenaria TaxID=6596 RepID=UPI00234ED62C|nr:uncharacterized protein LOC123544944 isoform X2 [Mercenaria mercenaria]